MKHNRIASQLRKHATPINTGSRFSKASDAKAEAIRRAKEENTEYIVYTVGEYYEIDEVKDGKTDIPSSAIIFYTKQN